MSNSWSQRNSRLLCYSNPLQKEQWGTHGRPCEAPISHADAEGSESGKQKVKRQAQQKAIHWGCRDCGRVRSDSSTAVSCRNQWGKFTARRRQAHIHMERRTFPSRWKAVSDTFRGDALRAHSPRLLARPFAKTEGDGSEYSLNLHVLEFPRASPG